MNTIRIYNKSNQSISLSARASGDFYVSEQQLTLLPGKSMLISSDIINIDQVKNLTARGLISYCYYNADE